MTNQVKRLLCVFKGHIFKFSTGISDLHDTPITSEYECVRCGKRKVIENSTYQICHCERCDDE